MIAFAVKVFLLTFADKLKYRNTFGEHKMYLKVGNGKVEKYIIDVKQVGRGRNAKRY